MNDDVLIISDVLPVVTLESFVKHVLMMTSTIVFDILMTLMMILFQDDNDLIRYLSNLKT